jgi:hypothetical protein
MKGVCITILIHSFLFFKKKYQIIIEKLMHKIEDMLRANPWLVSNHSADPWMINAHSPYYYLLFKEDPNHMKVIENDDWRQLNGLLELNKVSAYKKIDTQN